jgi:hypothetical protein
MKLVNLHSVGSIIDSETGTIYPSNIDGTPDLHCGVDVTDEPSDDWCSALSSADARTVAAIVQALN